MPFLSRTTAVADRLQKESDRLNEAVDRLASKSDAIKLNKETKALKEQLVAAEIDHAKHRENWEKEKRETAHMVGLQKQRGEQELELAKKAAEQERVTSVKAAELAVREANLETERKMMAEQIDNLEKNMEHQIAYLKDEVLSTVIKAVPNFNVDMVLDPHGSRDAAAQRKAIGRGDRKTT